MILRALYICKWSDVDLVFIGGTLFQIETTTTIHGATNLGCGILYKHRKVTWILMPSSFQLPKLSPEGRRVKTFWFAQSDGFKMQMSFTSRGQAHNQEAFYGEPFSLRKSSFTSFDTDCKDLMHSFLCHYCAHSCTKSRPQLSSP